MLYPGYRTLKSIKFLFTAPFILVLLFVINLMTGGEGWFKWAVLGIGIAWFLALVRVVWAVILAGGLAALGFYLFKRSAAATGAPPAPGAGAGTRPPDIPTVPLRRE
jgi:hypothetical protein